MALNATQASGRVGQPAAGFDFRTAAAAGAAAGAAAVSAYTGRGPVDCLDSARPRAESSGRWTGASLKWP